MKLYAGDAAVYIDYTYVNAAHDIIRRDLRYSQTCI